MLAALAITDNHDDTLRKVSKTMPWHFEAIKLITGCEKQAHKPLRTILEQDMDGLVMDCELNQRGITKGGQFIDTQGYIAHNDKIIVVSFRCTTSAFDWLTNFNTTSSAWELDEDAAQGYSGFCSGLDDFCCTGGKYKPRVHTGFYNNFLSVLSDIKKYVDPLLADSSKARTLYVVGHSLGAGIATVTGCYFITEYDWSAMDHRLVVVTAGSPRAICTSMKDFVDEKRKEYGDKCKLYRVVNGSDVVTSVPPKIFGFRHLLDPVKITDEGAVVFQNEDDDSEADLTELSQCRAFGQETHEVESETMNSSDDDAADPSLEPKSKYDRLVARVPKALRDHMPDFYLKPVLRNLGLERGSTRPVTQFEAPKTSHSKPEQAPEQAPTKKVNTPPKSKRGWFQ